MIFHDDTVHDQPVVAPEPDPHRILLAFENGELDGGLPSLPAGTISLEQLQETQPAENVRALIDARGIDPYDDGDD